MSTPALASAKIGRMPKGNPVMEPVLQHVQWRMQIVRMPRAASVQRDRGRQKDAGYRGVNPRISA